ncbi:helicase-related protein [Tessaracoccus palaemonis]|uniref:DEAD/DEAH box helicase n=1 Tax=Tessaracoccus palaemonis TaxID=2829499 RepID=A0ABX8SHL7_9ACTN|nr:helicase-related protein [Tessaracoccus palaemonis]QXT62881.1 DEAD/DEAH box helicase [Tessaracoccus palaemonis]
MTAFAVGSLVATRGREWVVLPDSSDDFLVLRPLGGTDDDIAGVLPAIEHVAPATFPAPSPDDLGDHHSARLLRSALQIGFRSSAGPFRSLAAIAVEPRAYQLVPLLMALRQDTVRLLIADDVGIGKTVEASLIATELLTVGDARGLVVLCSPALAEQWADELLTKFGLEAELVLASTVRRLERQCIAGESIFERFPVTVVSTDFIKSDRRRNEFLRTCPDLVIVDEAHTCVADGGLAGKARTQRYDLVRDLAARPDRHLLLVTATPHSGKDATFRNLIALLDPQLADIDLEQPNGRELLARHFVQRRRADIRQFLDENTPFPSDRLSKEAAYDLSPAYRDLFDDVLAYARETVRNAQGALERRVSWWSVLALLRALASSPRAAAQTLATRSAALAGESASEADALGRATVLDAADDEALESADVTPGADQAAGSGTAQQRRLRGFLDRARKLEGTGDRKLDAITAQVKELLADGYAPIVFCRFIDTAEYVAEHLRKKLGKGTTVGAVTGTLPPAERVARIAELTASEGPTVLVATDCLSEGVNLQEQFQAVVHYDLAWNPTRHEQREGRVDRFGQRRDVVRTVTLYGRDNHIDGIVLDVLLRKHLAIRKATGVSVPVPDNSDAVLEALMEGLILRGDDHRQDTLDIEYQQKTDELDREWQSAAEREKASRTKFAQRTIHPDEVQAEVAEIRAHLGTHADVRSFTETALRELKSTLTPQQAGFTATTAPLPAGLLDALPPGRETGLRFVDDFPVARGENVLHRTDDAVEAIATYVLESALDAGLPAEARPARRCAVIRTTAVEARTTLLLMRYRFHLTLPSRAGERTAVAEDVATLAFTTADGQLTWLDESAVRALLDATPTGNVANPRPYLDSALSKLPDLLPHLEQHGATLAERIRASHRRVRAASGSAVRGLGVRAENPPDVLGVYVFVPVPKG